MSDATAHFFRGIDGSERASMRAFSGSLRFDLTDDAVTDTWYLRFDCGRISASQAPLPFDALVRGEKAHFEAMVRGDLNLMTAILRGLVTVRGEFTLVVLTQRLFPGPRRPRIGAPAGYAQRLE